MISLRPYRTKDFVLIVVCALIWSFLSRYVFSNLGPQSSYIFMIIAITIIASIAVRLVRKIGAATLLFTLGALLSYEVGNLGISGNEKFISLLVAGLIFELVLIVMSNANKNTALLTAGPIASAAIPLVGALLISATVVQENISSVINFMILSGFAGIVGIIFGNWIWTYLRTTKFALRFLETLKE